MKQYIYMNEEGELSLWTFDESYLGDRWFRWESILGQEEAFWYTTDSPTKMKLKRIGVL